MKKKKIIAGCVVTLALLVAAKCMGLINTEFKGSKGIGLTTTTEQITTNAITGHAVNQTNGTDTATDPARQELRAIAVEFASNQFQKAKTIARRRGTNMPAEFLAFYQAAMQGDVKTMSNLFEQIHAQSGSFDSTSDRLEAPEWPTLSDTDVALETADYADPLLTKEFAQRICAVIPSNGIYFGGTDPGRFVITAFQHVLGRDDVSVLTQNGLCDANYMAYLRYSVARDHQVFIPSDDDVKEAFKAHTREVKARRKRGEQTEDEIKVANGNIISGTISGLMWVNGYLARMIFDRNTNTHAFCIEESYIINWMYPYLEPAGLILHLQPSPVTVTPAMVAADSNYWAALKASIGPMVPRDTEAQKAFAKCRCAIAGVYEYHKMQAEAERAYKDAIQLCPASAEANMRLASLLMKLDRYDDAISQAEAYQRSDPKNTRVADMIAAIKDAKVQAQKRGKRERP